MGGDDSEQDKGADDPLRALIAAGIAASPAPPPEREPTPPLQVAQQEDYDVCLRPKAALATFPYETERAITQLRRELDARRVMAIADEGIWRNGDERGDARFMVVPVWAWPLYDFKPDHDFWDTGFLERGFPKLGPSFSVMDGIKFYDVRFHPSGLAVPEAPTLDPASSAIPEQVFIPSKGGAPSKPWWDDLWVEINRQIYVGELSPARQVNIEKAMLDWSVAHGEKLSEASARVAARKLFKALNVEDKK